MGVFGAPPILEPMLVVGSDVHWGYDLDVWILTHGHMFDSWFSACLFCFDHESCFFRIST